jgi:N6-adenosine-specific RNA methylase IME4
MKYACIAADPPWNFDPRVGQGRSQTRPLRSVIRHYSTLSLDAIKALPVADLAARDSALFLWTTDVQLPGALEVMTAWGFKFATVAFHWAKTHKSGKFVTGCGWWTRANVEICLLGTRGSPKRLDASVKRLLIADRREHSRKPDEAYAAMQRLVAGPYLELFARTVRPGWAQAMSDQVDLFPPCQAA